MNHQLWNWIGWGAVVLCIPVVVWIFSNPKELGVKETRTLAAKAKSRYAAWLMLFSLFLVLIDDLMAKADKRVLTVERVLVFILVSIVVVLIVYGVTWIRTSPYVAESASDEAVSEWKRRMPSSSMVFFFLIFLVGHLIATFVKTENRHPDPKPQMTTERASQGQPNQEK